jgi:exopolyphosphatase/guanosine-5'-triphosphate,3'-diphosphate pyrophosphatase
MKVAAMDLGTNSFLCLIADVENGSVGKVHSDNVQLVRLGQDVNKTKKFHPDALARADSCLEAFSTEIKKQKPQAILAMATSAARDVTNAQMLFDIGKKHSIPIEVITGGLEAELTFAGATSHLPNDGKNRCIIDVGGGSTEFILGRDHQVLAAESVDIGCVRLTEEFVHRNPISDHDIRMIAGHIHDFAAGIVAKIQHFPIDEIIAVAGTPTAIAAIELGGFSHERVDNYLLSIENLKTWTKRFSSLSVEERMKNYNLERSRADVLPVGTLILWQALAALKKDRLTVSTKGVRFGLALEIERRSRK